jgi:hypothetical protein
MTHTGLDLDRLENAKNRGGKIIARCPACAVEGSDKSGEHLVIFDGGAGKWGCVAFAGDKEHRRRIAELVGIEALREPLRPLVLRPVALPRRSLELPALRIPTVGELAQLAELRGLPFFAGLELAVRAGQLRMAELRDRSEIVTAWVLLDSSARCAQARRLDGKQWRGIEAKAKTLPGSQAAWPIGAADIGDKPQVALAEGGPDFLAVWSLAWWHAKHHAVAPTFMAGSHPIHADAVPLFRGKGVFLIPHRDEAGARAQRIWTAQLLKAGAAWVEPFDVTPHKDLNELVVAVAAELDNDT